MDWEEILGALLIIFIIIIFILGIIYTGVEIWVMIKAGTVGLTILQNLM